MIADDRWFDWLLRVRHGESDVYAAALRPMLEAIRDRVLERANLGPGVRLVDLGCGEGLVGLAALEREPSLHATFVDISPALVAHVAASTVARGFAARSRCIVGSVESLDTIERGSVDSVTLRAVLAYVADKEAALLECARILRPGGRISLVDPIFADRAFALAGLAKTLPANPSSPSERYLAYLHRCGAAHLPDTLTGIAADPLTNYDERTLLRFLQSAGFVNVHLELHIDIVPALAVAWDVYLNTSPRAGAPTLREILATRFSAAERLDFERLARPGIEAGTTVERSTNAYMYADRGVAV